MRRNRVPKGTKFGKYLRDVRKLNNMTLEGLAERLDMSYNTLANIELGKSHTWPCRMEEILTAYGVDVIKAYSLYIEDYVIIGDYPNYLCYFLNCVRACTGLKLKDFFESIGLSWVTIYRGSKTMRESSLFVLEHYFGLSRRRVLELLSTDTKINNDQLMSEVMTAYERYRYVMSCRSADREVV